MPTEEQLLDKIRVLWQATDFGRREPQIDEAEEIDFYINSACASIQSCILLLRQAPSDEHADERLKEIETNLSLLREIADLAVFRGRTTRRD